MDSDSKAAIHVTMWRAGIIANFEAAAAAFAANPSAENWGRLADAMCERQWIAGSDAKNYFAHQADPGQITLNDIRAVVRQKYDGTRLRT